MKLKSYSLWLISIILLSLLIISFSIILRKNSTIEKLNNKEYTYNKNLTNTQFIEKLLSEQGIDKKYFDRKICFSIIEDDGSETVACFVPNKFEEYLKNVINVDEYKEKLSKSHVLNNVKELSFQEKEPFLQFLDFISPNLEKSSNKYLMMRTDLINLIKSNAGGLNEYLEYNYMIGLEGNFKEKIDFEKKICEKFRKMCEKDKVNITIKGKVLDQAGNPVENATLQILGDSITTVTNGNGEYLFTSKKLPFSKYRLQASKLGMSVGIYNIVLPTDSIKDWSFEHDFVLNTPLQTAHIDTESNTITGEGTSKDDKNFIIKTLWSEYKIPFDSLVKKDGTVFTGKVNAYFFEFNKSSKLDDLLANDIFDDVAGYAGNLMKTFGMPFVLFVTDNGEKIHILKSNPMILKNKIQEMDALFTGKDQIYTPLRNKDLEFLLKKSNELGGYPIDRDFLIKNNMLQFPAWWIYDQSKGIWVNHAIKLLNIDGTIETTFYTISEKY